MPIPSPTEHTYYKLYERFTAAALKGDLEAMRLCVNDHVFVAELPRLFPMTLSTFATYMGRLRSAAPDFGDNVRIVDIRVRDNHVVVQYVVTFTTVEGKTVTYTGTDWATIENDKIASLDVLFDRNDNQTQAFSEDSPKA